MSGRYRTISRTTEKNKTQGAEDWYATFGFRKAKKRDNPYICIYIFIRNPGLSAYKWQFHKDRDFCHSFTSVTPASIIVPDTW